MGSCATKPNATPDNKTIEYGGSRAVSVILHKYRSLDRNENPKEIADVINKRKLSSTPLVDFRQNLLYIKRQVQCKQ